MKKSMVQVAVFAAITMGIVQVAQAGAAWDMQSPEIQTAISGYEGDSSLSVTAPVDAAISSIRWGERANKPCVFSGLSRDLADMTHPRLDSDYAPTAVFCSNSFLKWTIVEFNANDRVIQGLSTCTTGIKHGANMRLKGFRIVAARIDNRYQRVVDTTEVSFKAHNNCKTWNEPVTCPGGQVATGLTIHRKIGSAVGVGLICRKLVWS